MKKESFIKAALIFGGGYLLFSVLKSAKSKSATTTDSTKSFDSTTKEAPAPTPENAKIVLTAYSDALNAGESPSRLSELNKECMKEFGMRCYVNNGEVVVCDVKGNPVSL